MFSPNNLIELPGLSVRLGCISPQDQLVSQQLFGPRQMQRGPERGLRPGVLRVRGLLEGRRLRHPVLQRQLWQPGSRLLRPDRREALRLQRQLAR